MTKLKENSNEFRELEKEWYREIDTLTSQSKFNNFIKKLTSGYEHDFGTSLCALACIVNATIRFYGGGLTPIQANYLMWKIIRKTFNYDDKIGLQLIQYEKLLYTNCEQNFELGIDKNQHLTLIDTAKIYLEKHKEAPKEVKEHWKKIASGWLPNNVVIFDDDRGEA